MGVLDEACKSYSNGRQGKIFPSHVVRLQASIDTSGRVALFDVLDADGGGELSVEELLGVEACSCALFWVRRTFLCSFEADHWSHEPARAGHKRRCN